MNEKRDRRNAPLLRGDLALMASRGFSDRELAAVYGVSDRTIQRWRKAEGIAPGTSFRPHRPSAGNYGSGCRCDGCRNAHREYQNARRKVRAGRAIPPYVTHGLPNTYSNWSCRCEACSEAHRVKSAAAYERAKARRQAVLS